MAASIHMSKSGYAGDDGVKFRNLPVVIRAEEYKVDTPRVAVQNYMDRAGEKLR